MVQQISSLITSAGLHTGSKVSDKQNMSPVFRIIEAEERERERPMLSSNNITKGGVH